MLVANERRNTKAIRTHRVFQVVISDLPEDRVLFYPAPDFCLAGQHASLARLWLDSGVPRVNLTCPTCLYNLTELHTTFIELCVADSASMHYFNFIIRFSGQTGMVR